MRRAAPRFAPALDFVTVEALVQLGWKVSVRALQLLVLVAYVLAVPLVFVVSAIVAALARAGLESGGANLAGRAWIVVVALAVLNAYLTAAYWFRETFSKRRFAVGGSPNTALLRALDVSALSMFTAACLVRTLVVFSLATVATLAVVAMFAVAIEPSLAVALVLLPVASGVGMLAICARYAARNTRVRPRIRVRYALGAAPLVAGSGFVVAQAAMAAQADVARDVGARTLVIGATASWLALAAIAMSIALAAVALRSAIADLRRHSFEIEQTAPDARPATSGGPRSLVEVLHLELRSGNPFFLLQKSALVLVLAIAFLVGFRLGGPDLVPIADGHGLWTRVALLMTFVSSLTATELVLNACGPVTLRNQLRYAWDCGAPVPRMLPAAVAYWLLPSLLIATAATVSLYLLSGQITLSPLAVGAATASASLLAGALSAVPRSHADGSGDTSLFVALLTVILAIPALAAFVSADALVSVVGLIYVLVLMGGALVWIAKRIRFLPSSSTA